MGTIHLAEEVIANQRRKVVIKEMLDYYDTGDPQSKAKARRRFESEAATLAALNIAGVPQIFDYFHDGGRNYIVMQFIEGRNLEAGLTHEDDDGNIVKGRPYPVDQVRSWGAKICKILVSLGKNGVYHLDIKPANLIVDPAGEVWLVDFGTAKAGVKWLASGQPGRQKSSVYGTIGYAAPEQKAGKPEARSDVYALAATLYHLLTDDDPRDTPYAYPKLDRLPSNLSKVLSRALVNEPARRIDAAEFGRLLASKPQRANSFHWRDGSVTQTPDSLALDSAGKWDEALGYFKGGQWERWLKDWHRNDMVAQIQTQRAKYGDQNLALDAFLRSVEPNFPAPKLHLPVPSFDIGVLPWNSQRTLKVELVNQGSGCLQAKFVNIPPGLKVEPAEVVTHERQTVKVHINTRAMTPGKVSQTLSAPIDAGSGGRGKLAVTVLIPAPDLEIDRRLFDFGYLYRDATVTERLVVKNKGGSPCWVDLQPDEEWLSVHPARFLCPAGDMQEVEISVATQRMRYARHRADLELLARAGGWRLNRNIQIDLTVSALYTVVRELGRPISWVTGLAVVGALLGWRLSTWLGDGGAWMPDLGYSLLYGVFWSVIFCVPAGLLVGALKGSEESDRKQTVKRGGLSGLIVGMISGVAAGYLSHQILGWLGLNVDPEQAIIVFGALVGGFAGAVYGAVSWLMFFD